MLYVILTADKVIEFINIFLIN